MNQDQWNQKKSGLDAAPAERSRPVAARAAAPRSTPPTGEVVAAIKHAASAERTGDGNWNPWQP